MREMKTVVIVGCYLGAGQMLRVRPVHVVRTVVVHVHQLVGQHCPHLLLSGGEVGADDHLVVSEVIPTDSQWSVTVRCQPGLTLQPDLPHKAHRRRV